MYSIDLRSPEAQPSIPTRIGAPVAMERDYMEFWNRNYCNYYGNGLEDSSEYSNRSEKTSGFESNELQEVLNYVPSLPKPKLLQSIPGNKVNFILISTSLDQAKIRDKLTNTLERQTSRVIPLSFQKDEKSEKSEDNASDEPETFFTRKTIDDQNEYSLECNKRKYTRTLKRNDTQDVKKKYSEYRYRSNRETQRSREMERSCMTWIETRTKELEEENVDLEQQLKILKARELPTA